MTSSNKGIFSSSFGYAVSKKDRTQEIDFASREILLHDALIEIVKSGGQLPAAPGDLWSKLDAVCSSEALADAFDMNALDVIGLSFAHFMANDDAEYVAPQWAIDGATLAYEAAKREANRQLEAYQTRSKIASKTTPEGEQVVAYADAVLARLQASPYYFDNDLKGLKAYRRKQVAVRSRAAKAIKDGRAK